MNFDDGYNQCKGDVKKFLLNKELDDLWSDLEHDLIKDIEEGE